MLKLGIIGYPLEHSLSPQMHTAALQYLNINSEYKAYEIKENEFDNKIKQLIKSGIKGFNVTIPYKTKIVPVLDELTERAKSTGAVNTVTVLDNGKTIGDNTDVTGFWEAIPEDIRKNISTKNITIIGCGGAAYAATFALLSNGAKSIKVYGRNKDKLSSFKDLFKAIDIDLIENINLSNTDILVNATPVGMYPDIEKSPLSKEKLSKMPKSAFVYDLIYNPQETKLLKDAKSLNLKTINGTEMLIRQGAKSLAIWLDLKEVPIGVMRQATKELFFYTTA